MPDRAKENSAIMRCRTRVVPLRTVNESLNGRCDARAAALSPTAKVSRSHCAISSPVHSALSAIVRLRQLYRVVSETFTCELLLWGCGYTSCQTLAIVLGQI